MFLFNWMVGEGRGVRLKLDVQGQVGGRILDVDGGGFWKLDNFDGRHTCIIPNLINQKRARVIYVLPHYDMYNISFKIS